MSIRINSPSTSEGERKLREMNELLIISSIHQHELVEKMQRTEEALRKSEAWRRLALDAAGLGAWSIEPNSFELTSDERFRAIFGISTEQLGYEAALTIIHPDDLPMVLDAVDAAIKPDHAKPFNLEYRVVHKDASIHWVYGSGRANFYRNGSTPVLASFDGTIADITDRRLAEEAVRESTNLFRVVAETVPQKIFIADLEGNLTYANPQYYAYTGLPESQIQDLNTAPCIHSEDSEAQSQAWKHSIHSQEPFHQEYRLRQEDGLYRWHLTRAIPMLNEEGQVLSWISASTDVDDARREDTVNRERLEHAVELRTRELLDINEQLQGFTYSVAHDLRQQIRGISTNASILKLESAGLLSERCLQVVDRLGGNARQLAALVDDLLAYARLGRQEPNKIDFDYTEMAEQVSKLILEREECPSLPRFVIQPGLIAHGDPLLIRIVAENLMENACKYSPGAVDPTIEIGKVGENYFCRDYGLGFDMEFHDRLFQPFERLHHDRKIAGTGIGLANVKRIIEKHGGEAWAESSPGKGSTFWFSLGKKKPGPDAPQPVTN